MCTPWSGTFDSRRRLLAAAITVLTVSGSALPVTAAPEPTPAAPPGPSAPAGPAVAAAPLAPTVQATACHMLAVLPGTDPRRRGHAARTLDYRAAWRYSRGAGQTIAVIDTGVQPHPRLGTVRAGGDFVSTGTGLEDCDAHGTAVAGIIAARPDPSDEFAGVAPDAVILAIRQTSAAFEAAERGVNAFGNVTTLARAVLRAVDLGATIINISQVACAGSAAELGDEVLGAAVRTAHERGVLVVAAAGNVGSRSPCTTQNDPGDGGAAVPPLTLATPARFADHVLTVAAAEPDGRIADFSLAGPWVQIAAPGTDIVSLDPRGPGLVNGQPTREGIGPLGGTSFAAPYVSGVAALVRARFPLLGPDQVRERLLRTARPVRARSAGGPPIGVIDPLAAVTATLPTIRARAPGRLPLAAPKPAAPPARRSAVLGTGVILTALMALAGLRAVSSSVARRRGGPDLQRRSLR